MEVPQALEKFLAREGRRGTLAGVRRMAPVEAEYADWPEGLDPRILAGYGRRGIDRPFSHQAESIRASLSGRDVVVVTPTASGKTLCYNVPVLQAVLEDDTARALYLFPTKALSRDQTAELLEVIDALDAPLRTETYDGDTPADARRAIRAQAHVVVTNPDMLHAGVLPHHAKWAKLFQNLRYVVLDELHTYRGVFGSHVANLIRRLRRVCRFYGSDPRYICCSATIANPGELAERLLEREVELVDRSGAPRGEKVVIFYNPPVVNPQLGIRRSYLSTARDVAAHFLSAGVTTILFARSRLNVEVLTKYLKEACADKPQLAGRIRGYRGGYLPTVRREIEQGLRSGEVLGVVSTNALELGIDIGSLDVAVLAGYPGTVASTWQQAGRAGRREGLSVAVLVARSEPTDQFLMSYPDYFFGRSPEHGLINPENLLIRIAHVKCAAFELPIEDRESLGGEDLSEILEYLAEEDLLHHSGDQWHWTADAYPAQGISLRSIPEENFTVMDLGRRNLVIGEVDFRSAPMLIHEDAIYLSEGTSYIVKRLEYERRQAYIERADADYFTDAITNTSVRVIDVFDSSSGTGTKTQGLPTLEREDDTDDPGDGTRRPAPRAEASAPEPDDGATRVEHGEVHVTWNVSGFKKIKFGTHENVGYGEVKLPDQEMTTTAYWFTLRREMLAELSLARAEVLDGVAGLARVLHGLAPFLLMCDGRDIRHCVGDRSARWFARAGIPVARGGRPGPTLVGADGVELPAEGLPDFEPTIFLYDAFPGGMGFSMVLFDEHEDLIRRAAQVMESCPCDGGCPSCVGPSGREAARVIAERLLREMDAPRHRPGETIR